MAGGGSALKKAIEIARSIVEPEKSVPAYKLFRQKGDDLYPLFVNANKPVPVGEWLPAESGPMVGEKVKSSLGPLAYRPGWHAGDLPIATHIGGKSEPGLKAPDYRPDNQVWASVLMPDDVDWQQEALARAMRNKAGEIIPRTAHITDQIPVGGHYRYKTNPNMTGNWLIGGSMKVDRVLPDDEVRAINEAASVSDLPRLYELMQRRGYSEGGSLLQDKYPPHYMPGVGRQVMADGGAPAPSAAITGPHTITASDLVGVAAPAGQNYGAYADAGGQQIAAPFVSSMSGGYPVYNMPSPSTSALPPHVQEMMDRLRHRGQRPGAHSFPSPFAGGYAEGGPVDDAISLAKMIADNRAHYDEGGLVNKVLSYLHGLKVPDPVLPIPTRLPTRDEAIETAKAAITPVDPYEASGEAVQQYRSGDPVGAFSTMAGAVPLQGMAKKPVVKRSTELPDISTMPREQAIAIARKEPHLIPAGDQSEGFYVGSPRDIMSKRGLTNRRKAFDAYVAADPRGSDWYDRYRNAVTEVTGQDPRSVDWMTKTHGMMSAGVDPGSETQFALRETNGQIAGMPVKAARPAQHEALQDAINARDPSLIMLGDKTGEYARLIHPDQTHGGATGVNDFRHARNWGYTEASGADQRDALTQAQHRFMDFETALAVDRANKIGLGGKFDWTGEQLQAAPWVRQKALAIAEKRKMPYEEAFQEANKTIADFFPKHTAFATHEAIPGPSTGHLPGLPTALQAARDAYSADPRSLWNNAPGGRDAIYSGLGVEGTGVNMRVRPSIDMQGADQPKGMDLQFNRGQTARPLVAFDTSGPAKTVAPADTALLNTGELVRAYIDARDAGAWHKPFLDAPAGHSNSYFIPMDRKATLDEIQRMRQSGREHGIGDVEDTGQGMTVTSFDPGPPIFDRSGRKAVENALALARPEGSGSAQRAFIDSGYLGLTDEWQQGIGSGAATRKILGELNQNPQLRAAFDNNPYIPANALARMERDAEYAAQYGATRQDIQNARRIIGEGPGWVGRLEKALKDGVLLPALGAAILAPAMMQPDANAQSGG